MDSRDLASASQAVPMVEVAGIEPCPTTWNLREPLVSRTKSREPSGPIGKHLNQPLTPSTYTWTACCERSSHGYSMSQSARPRTKSMR